MAVVSGCGRDTGIFTLLSVPLESPLGSGLLESCLKIRFSLEFLQSFCADNENGLVFVLKSHLDGNVFPFIIQRSLSFTLGARKSLFVIPFLNILDCTVKQI